MFNSKCFIKLLHHIVYGKKKTNTEVVNLLASEFRQTLNIQLIFIGFINVRHVSKWSLNLILLSRNSFTDSVIQAFPEKEGHISCILLIFDSTDPKRVET